MNKWLLLVLPMLLLIFAVPVFAFVPLYNITSDATFGDEDNLREPLFASSNGTLWVVALRNPNVTVFQSNNNGKNWSIAQRDISGGNGASIIPYGADIDANDNIYVAYTALGTAYLSVFNTTDGSSAQIDIASYLSTGVFYDVAVDSTNKVWIFYDDGNDLVYATSDDAFTTENYVPISFTPEWESLYPIVSVDKNDNIHIVYSTSVSGNNMTSYINYTQGVWSTPIDLFECATGKRYMISDHYDNLQFVCYNSSYQILYAKKGTGSSVFSDAVSIFTLPTVRQNNIVVEADKSNALYVFFSYNLSTKVMVSHDNGTTWSSPFQITPDGSSSNARTFAIAGRKDSLFANGDIIYANIVANSFSGSTRRYIDLTNGYHYLTNFTVSPSQVQVTNNTNITVEFNATPFTGRVFPIDTVLLYLNGTVYSALAVSGVYTVSAPVFIGNSSYYWYSNDSVGNFNTSAIFNYSVSRDKWINMTLNTPNNNTVTSNLIHVAGNAVGSSTISNITFFVDAGLLTYSAVILANPYIFDYYPYNITSLSNGLHTFHIEFHDAIGSFAEINTTFTKNVTSNGTVVITSPSGNLTNSSNINLNFTYTNGTYSIDQCWYNINGTNVTLPGCAGNIILPLASGNYTVYVYANDTAGNTVSSSFSFEILNAPTPPAPPVTGKVTGVTALLLNLVPLIFALLFLAGFVVLVFYRGVNLMEIFVYALIGFVVVIAIAGYVAAVTA